jgi:regulator of protease activity HflC (stomatin/prohibitin superfamily)
MDTVFVDGEKLNVEIRKELESTLTSWDIEILEIELKSTSEWD